MTSEFTAKTKTQKKCIKPHVTKSAHMLVYYDFWFCLTLVKKRKKKTNLFHFYF